MLARPFSLGPGDLQKMEVRIRGPEADTVQRLAGEVRRSYPENGCMFRF